MTGVAMPEWLTRQDIQDPSAWRVEEGSVVRGDSWTDLDSHAMRAPVGHGDAHRVIRAREMMRARVSPANHNTAAAAGVSVGSLAAAEDYRVNHLVKALDFDVDHLADGSERITGERLAEAKDYASLVHFTASTAGTKGCASFLRGVKAIDENLGKSLREVEKSLVKDYNKSARRVGVKATASRWGSTEPTAALLPKGYLNITVPAARRLDEIIRTLSEPPASEDGDTGEDENERGGGDPILVRDIMSGRAGVFATLSFAHLPLTRTVQGSLGRKRTATNIGRNPRRINRALTDPQRRVFDRTRRNIGGVVLIDQSGSMHLTTEEVEEMMQASPGCTIIGYSHGRGKENIWVMAKAGRRTEVLPEGNGGNGVDGPALRYAVSQARRGEPVVWVCDGLVTSRDDGVYDNLDNECARLVRRHKVHMAKDVADGVVALQDVAKGNKPKVNYVGNVRRAAVRLGFL
jgi:hypothetical protein